MKKIKVRRIIFTFKEKNMSSSRKTFQDRFKLKVTGSGRRNLIYSVSYVVFPPLSGNTAV